MLREADREVIFVGDADPVDLLVFAWLREHLSTEWFGVSDRFLLAQGMRFRPRVQIPLASSEQETIEQLGRFCPDYRMLLGKECSALLDAGMKIELEGALLKE